ncbi:unnamed protein product [Blumeria hordei]|uniref:Inhibitor I9 domain-containing protein n=2 Tax=Blumeria hordei TaxID=2867405 RepID=A0A383UZA9_BLUHO|nr:hypothetical protein BGHDH14_bgh03513 [Blumeria hordei DH14]SZF04928.1 unnamed protein product [Blumeria hordei]
MLRIFHLLTVLIINAITVYGMSVIISFPKTTPDDVIQDTKSHIEKNGGVVDHDLQIINGFSTTASNTIIEQILDLKKEWAPEMELDSTVTIS